MDQIPISACDDSSSRESDHIERSDYAVRLKCLIERGLREVSSTRPVAAAQEAPKLGVDVVDIGVMTRQLNSLNGAQFKRRVFTQKEIADSRDQVAKLAARWAVKEAVSKAIGTGFRQGLHPSDIEVLKAADGSIRVAPAVGRGWPHCAENWHWAISAAHDGGVAVAVALALP
jgi:holo-[acyl-carrier protein] synthase